MAKASLFQFLYPKLDFELLSFASIVFIGKRDKWDSIGHGDVHVWLSFLEKLFTKSELS